MTPDGTVNSVKKTTSEICGPRFVEAHLERGDFYNFFGLCLCLISDAVSGHPNISVAVVSRLSRSTESAARTGPQYYRTYTRNQLRG